MSRLLLLNLAGITTRILNSLNRWLGKQPKAGAHAIKLQTYTADSMTLNVNHDEFVIQEQDSLWKGEALHGLYAKASTPYDWHKPLFELANSLGMEAFSSPFDEEAVDFLDDLGVPCFKIASFELTDIPLIRKGCI